jgi:hypothetical protein
MTYHSTNVSTKSKDADDKNGDPVISRNDVADQM